MIRARLAAPLMILCLFWPQTLDFVEVPMEIEDEVMLLKWTVAMEAEGEPYTGKLAVAWTIMNRARKFKWSLSDTILKDRHFSAWNQNSPTRMRLDIISKEIMDDAKLAAMTAYYHVSSDPTLGATHYLNKKLIIKAQGELPLWAATMRETVTIGRHTFYV